MSLIIINTTLVILCVCALMLVLHKILHPAAGKAAQIFRSIWVILLSLLLTVFITGATAGAIDKELTLRAEFAKLQLQILQLLTAPKGAPQPKA